MGKLGACAIDLTLKGGNPALELHLAASHFRVGTDSILELPPVDLSASLSSISLKVPRPHLTLYPPSLALVSSVFTPALTLPTKPLPPLRPDPSPTHYITSLIAAASHAPQRPITIPRLSVQVDGLDVKVSSTSNRAHALSLRLGNMTVQPLGPTGHTASLQSLDVTLHSQRVQGSFEVVRIGRVGLSVTSRSGTTPEATTSVERSPSVVSIAYPPEKPSDWFVGAREAEGITDGSDIWRDRGLVLGRRVSMALPKWEVSPNRIRSWMHFLGWRHDAESVLSFGRWTWTCRRWILCWGSTRCSRYSGSWEPNRLPPR